MNKFFLVLLALALFVFEVKSDHISKELLKRIIRLIDYLKDNRLWEEFLRYKHYSEDYAIKWCMQYETYEVCDAIIDDYLDDYDDDDDYDYDD